MEPTFRCEEYKSDNTVISNRWDKKWGDNGEMWDLTEYDEVIHYVEVTCKDCGHVEDEPLN